MYPFVMPDHAAQLSTNTESYHFREGMVLPSFPPLTRMQEQAKAARGKEATSRSHDRRLIFGDMQAIQSGVPESTPEGGLIQTQAIPVPDHTGSYRYKLEAAQAKNMQSRRVAGYQLVKSIQNGDQVSANYYRRELGLPEDVVSNGYYPVIPQAPYLQPTRLAPGIPVVSNPTLQQQLSAQINNLSRPTAYVQGRLQFVPRGPAIVDGLNPPPTYSGVVNPYAVLSRKNNQSFRAYTSAQEAGQVSANPSTAFNTPTSTPLTEMERENKYLDISLSNTSIRSLNFTGSPTSNASTATAFSVTPKQYFAALSEKMKVQRREGEAAGTYNLTNRSPVLTRALKKKNEDEENRLSKEYKANIEAGFVPDGPPKAVTSGLSGNGLPKIRIKRMRFTPTSGRGFGDYKVDKNYGKLGQYLFHKGKLASNILSILREKSRFKTNEYPNQKISDSLVKMIQICLMGESPPSKAFQALPHEEQWFLSRMVKRSKCTHVTLPHIDQITASYEKKEKETDHLPLSELKNKLQVCLGEIKSGNNSHLLQTQTENILQRCVQHHLLSYELAQDYAQTFHLTPLPKRPAYV